MWRKMEGRSVVISQGSALMGRSEREPAHTAALGCIVSERGLMSAMTTAVWIAALEAGDGRGEK